MISPVFHIPLPRRWLSVRRQSLPTVTDDEKPTLPPPSNTHIRSKYMVSVETTDNLPSHAPIHPAHPSSIERHLAAWENPTSPETHGFPAEHRVCGESMWILGLSVNTWEYWEQSLSHRLLGFLSFLMWQRLKHIVHDLRAYPYLSPDLKIRRQVQKRLEHRPVLSLADWYANHGKDQALSFAVTEFAYNYLGRYAGIDFGRLLPSDRLEDDLSWTQICWFDWYLSLSDDFYHHFKIDLSGELADIPTSDLAALLQFLEQHHQTPQLEA